MHQSRRLVDRHRPWPDDAEELFTPEVATAEPASLPITAKPISVEKKRQTDSQDTHFGSIKAIRALSRGDKSASGSYASTHTITHARPAWIWGVFGFACGVVFWHFIGFWSFISEIVTPSPNPRATEKPSSAVPSPSQQLVTRPARPARPRSVGAAPAPIQPDMWTVDVEIFAADLAQSSASPRGTGSPRKD